MTMKFERLHIYASMGGLKGSVQFEGPAGKIELTLNESLGQRILEVCGDDMIAVSKKAAEVMAGAIAEAAAPVNLIEGR